MCKILTTPASPNDNTRKLTSEHDSELHAAAEDQRTEDRQPSSLPSAAKWRELPDAFHPNSAGSPGLRRNHTMKTNLLYLVVRVSRISQGSGNARVRAALTRLN
ncbi:hypothetical protein E2C01_017861 [Portunus trituberculatus]|uniref:Uncharacterized protein n=1 Tax=Portunus trituberculatus TaxID=210409 RepID=A0A5B7DUN1_PORTR|nr:hypothetical protein [Portunus trituberculatus]